MPSVSSSCRPKVLDSSTVMTPSLPTLSMASAVWSPAEIPAVAAICSLVSTSLADASRVEEIFSTAFSMPRLRPSGLAPAATLRRPSFTSACASTVAVVVPSPATSSVFFATSLTSSAPIFSHGSSSSISFAMDTPSLVIVGAPHFFSSTTFRPLGPRVTFTASASWFIPRSRPRLASSSNAIILAAIGSSPPWRNARIEPTPATDGTPTRTVPSCREAVPHRPIPPSCWHSHKESASTMFSTLLVRVQTIAPPARADGPPAARYYGELPQRERGGFQGGRPPLIKTARPPEGPGRLLNPADQWPRPNPGPQANLRDYDNLVGLRAPVALRDLELDPLSLFEGAVAIRLDSREMDENVLATVDGDKAVSLVRVEPFDGALSHSKQLPNYARAFEPRPCHRGTRRSPTIEDG